MNIENFKNDESIKTLIELGTKGHFLLFDHKWPIDYERIEMSDFYREKIENVLNEIVKYKDLEKRKMLICSLPKEERAMVIKVFLKLVETKLLDSGAELH